MWTHRKGKLAAFGATVAIGMLMPTVPAFAADPAPTTAVSSAQTSATTTDKTSGTYTAVSNIMKTQHDTVVNTISNLR